MDTDNFHPFYIQLCNFNLHCLLRNIFRPALFNSKQTREQISTAAQFLVQLTFNYISAHARPESSQVDIPTSPPLP